MFVCTVYTFKNRCDVCVPLPLKPDATFSRHLIFEMCGVLLNYTWGKAQYIMGFIDFSAFSPS